MTSDSPYRSPSQAVKRPAEPERMTARHSPMKAALPIATVVALLHAVAWGGVFELLTFIARLFRIFEDFDVALPAATMWLLDACHYAAEHRRLALVAGFAALVGDWIILLLCYLYPHTAAPRRLWIGLMFLVPAMFLVGSVIALLLPLVGIINQLS